MTRTNFLRSRRVKFSKGEMSKGEKKVFPKFNAVKRGYIDSSSEKK